MDVASSCRDSLMKFECACRDNTINFENLHPILDQLFLINGEIPTEIQDIALLDVFISHFSLNCEKEIRNMVFHLLFPCTLNPNPLREEFLIRLTQLAICVGVSPILDLVAVRLKAQIFLAIKSLQTPQERQLDIQLIPACRVITHFVRRVMESAITVRGLTSSCKHILQKLDFAEAMNSDQPLFNLLCISPLLVSALVSGITLSYVAPLTRDPTLSAKVTSNISYQAVLLLLSVISYINRDKHSNLQHYLIRISQLNPKNGQGHKHDCHQSPPPILLEVLLIWLKSARLQSLQSNWMCIDWESLFIKTPPLFLENAQSPNLPSLIANAWPVARGLVWWTLLTADRYRVDRSCEILDGLFSELHYEVLEQFASPLPRSGGGRKFPIVNSGYPDLTWRLHFPGDLLPIGARLAGARENAGVSTQLSVFRLAEIIQIAWSSDRIFDCDSSDLHNLLKSFNSHRIIQLVLHSLRR